MVLDSLASAQKYTSLHPLFAKAFEYIASQDLAAMEVGKYEIDGENLRAIVSDKEGVTAEASLAKFECHDKHIDIQVCVRGNEKIGWVSRTKCTQQKGEYNPEKDVVFYADAPDTFFTLTDNQFVIFYPEDVHAPMIAVDGAPIKKMVVKVKI